MTIYKNMEKKRNKFEQRIGQLKIVGKLVSKLPKIKKRGIRSLKEIKKSNAIYS